MRLQYADETSGKMEWHKISIDDFLSMDVESFIDLGVTDIKTTLLERKKLKEKYREELKKLNSILERHGLPPRAEESKHIEDAYISLCNDINSYRELENQVDMQREAFADKQSIDLDEKKLEHERKREQLQLQQEREVADIDKQISDLEKKAGQQEQELETMNSELEAKKARLEELKAKKSDSDARLAEAASPENLTNAYMADFHKRFNAQISAIKGKVLGDDHRRWVTNGAPVDANGRPITTFDSEGNLIGTPAGYLFPDMDCSGVRKGVNYCTLSAVSCLNGTDKKCGVDIISTDPFVVEGEKVTPYLSGKKSYKKGNEAKHSGETLDLCPYGIPACFGDTVYVSGFDLRREKFLKRENGEKSIDYGKERIPPSVMDYDDNSTIGKICRPENLKTDEKTGEKYYEYIDKNGNRQYMKDGDLLCLKVGKATNSSTGTHTIVVNIDQKTGKVTHTSGNWDAVNGSMDGYANTRTHLLLKDAPAAVFHTSEFVNDKIASFDEDTRKQIAQRLGTYNDNQYDAEIAALEAEIANDERQIADKQKELEGTKGAIEAKKTEKETLLTTHEQQKQGLEEQLSQDLLDFQQEQSSEKTSFEEKIEEVFKVFYETGTVDFSEILGPFFGGETEGMEEPEEDLLFGRLMDDGNKAKQYSAALESYAQAGQLQTVIDTHDNTGDFLQQPIDRGDITGDKEIAVDWNKGKGNNSAFVQAIARRNGKDNS